MLTIGLPHHSPIMFDILTPLSYWVLLFLWAGILVFYVRRLVDLGNQSRMLIVLFFVLAVDAFCTIFETIYFGLAHTSQAGFLPLNIYDVLSQPQYVFIPKALKIFSALLIIFLLLRWWLPRAAEARLQNRAHINALEQQQRIAREAMEQRNKFLVGFMEDSHLAITVYDDKGLLVRANDAWRKIWEIDSLDEVVDRYNILTDPQARRHGVSAVFEKVLTDKSTGEFRGEFVPMESGMPGVAKVIGVNLYPMVVSGEVFRVICINQDLTGEYRRRAEQKRQAHNQGALEMAGAACHELNQPLQVVMAQLELLSEPQGESEARRRTATMRAEVQRMAGIIRKMEDLTTVKSMGYLGDTRIIDINGSQGKRKE